MRRASEKSSKREFAHNPTYTTCIVTAMPTTARIPLHAGSGEPARQYVGRVIAAGCEEPEVAAERLGWEAADTLEEAIAMATADHGRRPR